MQDRDEFEAACRDGHITPADAEAAEATARTLEHALTTRQPPFGDEGRHRLLGLR